jgi:hypothetical protein
MLMTRGIRSWMGDKVKEQIELDNEARALSPQRAIARLTRMMSQLAQSKGMDGSKFI